ncbi:MAG TPA: FAD-dependent oxidoreductase [Myxococcales bacterium]|nr:FAD-dependent oxidoreductase [Myxococcales bacterium]
MDVAVIGAGVIGAAVANKLAERGMDVVLLEAQKRPCTGISSRNSGVIHSGLYYHPNSLKARSCIRGQALLYEWCERFQVPHRRTGKLIVGDVDALEELWSHAIENGAKGCRLLGAGRLLALEPSLGGHSAALFCGFSGIGQNILAADGVTFAIQGAFSRRAIIGLGAS